MNSPKKKSCNFSFNNSSPIKAYPNFNDKKIIIIYDTYKNYFYLYGNNRDKKRLSAPECKIYGTNGPKIKLFMNFFKNDYYNKNNYKNDFLNNKNINKESFFEKKRVNTLLFNNININKCKNYK